MRIDIIRRTVEESLNIVSLAEPSRNHRLFIARTIFAHICVDGFIISKKDVAENMNRSVESLNYSLRQHEIMKKQDNRYINSYIKVLGNLEDISPSECDVLRNQFFDVSPKNYHVPAVRRIMTSLEGVHHADIADLYNNRIVPFLKSKGYVCSQ